MAVVVTALISVWLRLVVSDRVKPRWDLLDWHAN